jgi:hypothetical protein
MNGSEKRDDSPLDNLSPEKRAAYRRLKADFSIIARNAKRTGKSIEKYMMDLGFDKETVALLAREFQTATQEQKQAPTPKTAGEGGQINLGIPPTPAPEPLRQIIENPISAAPEPQQIDESSLPERSAASSRPAAANSTPPLSIERRKSMAKIVLDFVWSWSFLRAFAVLFFMALAAYFVFTYREDNRYSISSNSSGTFVLDKRTGEIKFLIVQPNGEVISLKEYRTSR